MKYKSLFISDVHLGVEYSNLSELLDLLKQNEFDNIFLVGDIIDGWKLKRKFFWKTDENTFIQKILRYARKGGNVVYLIGNHDEFLYEFKDESFGNILVTEEYVYTTVAGEKILLMHGHQFDGIVKCNKWLQHLGSALYDFLLFFNKYFNIVRRKLGFKYWSISSYLKQKAKKSVSYVSNYEETLVNYAKNYSTPVNSIMCGHIHCPKVVEGDVVYYNCGDWVENASFFVETLDGEILLHKIEKK